mmetsp:Transcript_3784/g.7342  ORF Transcript_3784/g.7342 Transcript_3784/m.7342 type:complete len:356 (+) Transcript_3784:832-1899(+)
MRQDAVMEQLFQVVNSLLQENPATRERQLSIRTYNVVPFTAKDGLLEWVEQTLPLTDYLLGANKRGGAHELYRPQDWTYFKCRECLTSAGVGKRVPGQASANKMPNLRAALDTIYANFKPVMHHFFLEKFHQPAEWYMRRVSFTRSVAANSMVGYLVGLGDRHSSNILIDERSAEVVHIDLGIAFEQGRLLQTPELIPFRLTRDIVDGMGVTGVEGAMRRCCEKTIQVLRANKEVLLTIIEVFIHDPLYKWALTAARALQRQADDQEEGPTTSLRGQAKSGSVRGAAQTQRSTEAGNAPQRNADAERVLTRIRQKLDGFEGGEMLSVQGQVQKLLQDAQDPDKLCRLFAGWAPWV